MYKVIDKDVIEMEIVKNQTKSVSKGTGLSWEARITRGEKEVPKRRAEVFFRLKPGEFIVFADGKDRKILFKLQHIEKGVPKVNAPISESNINIFWERLYRITMGL